MSDAPDEGLSRALYLLLHTSGDPRAEQLRLGLLRRFSESLARLAGWTAKHPHADELLLRAQLVIAIGLGIATLRTSKLEPIASTGTEVLSGRLGELVQSVFGGPLSRRAGRRT
ncbi:MAG: hypothetical protein QM765_47225 [Myxococcales bacterium]